MFEPWRTARLLEALPDMWLTSDLSHWHVVVDRNPQDIMDIFDELHRKGNTIIIVTHEPDISDHAHRIIRLMDGLVSSDEMNPTHAAKL